MTTPRVSDHALIRWLERRHGINLDEVRRELADLVRPFHAIGATGFPLCGVWVVMNGDDVVTVTPAQPKFENRIRNDRGRRKPEAPFQGEAFRMRARKKAHK